MEKKNNRGRRNQRKNRKVARGDELEKVLVSCRESLTILKDEREKLEQKLEKLNLLLSSLQHKETTRNYIELDFRNCEKGVSSMIGSCFPPKSPPVRISFQFSQNSMGFKSGHYVLCRSKPWDINKLTDTIYGMELPKSAIATAIKLDNGLISQWKSNPTFLASDLNYLKELLVVDKMEDGLSPDLITKSLALVTHVPSDVDIQEQVGIHLQQLASKNTLSRETLTPFEKNDFVKGYTYSIGKRWVSKIANTMFTDKTKLPHVRAGLPSGYLKTLIPNNLYELKDSELRTFLRYCNLLDPLIWVSKEPSTDFFDILAIVRPQKKTDTITIKAKSTPLVMHVIKIVCRWIKLLRSRDPYTQRTKVYKKILSKILDMPGYSFNVSLRTRELPFFEKQTAYGEPIPILARGNYRSSSESPKPDERQNAEDQDVYAISGQLG